MPKGECANVYIRTRQSARVLFTCRFFFCLKRNGISKYAPILKKMMICVLDSFIKDTRLKQRSEFTILKAKEKKLFSHTSSGC